MQAQMKMKAKGMYAGEANGNLDGETRAGLKKFQEAEKIRATGTLNRITLERMNIQLSEAQMKIPVTESSMTPDSSDATEKTSTSARFRATKDQITQAQKMLAAKNLYAGEQSGRMTDDFRAALKKYQKSENLASTGTLNRETIEKMGIPLTDKQKAMTVAAQPK
jgi:peptidoglycan hydrolase-like protein with peptidoglycan-binding domain